MERVLRFTGQEARSMFKTLSLSRNLLFVTTME